MGRGQKVNYWYNFTNMKGVTSIVFSELFTSELENVQKISRQFF